VLYFEVRNFKDYQHYSKRLSQEVLPLVAEAREIKQVALGLGE